MRVIGRDAGVLLGDVVTIGGDPHSVTNVRRVAGESCGDCGGSGADSSGKCCGTCNGLGEIYCRVADRQGVRVPSRFSIRKDNH